jgi:hypothetical protein
MEKRYLSTKQCCECDFTTVVDDRTDFCRVCVHLFCVECEEVEFLTCCQCSQRTESHSLSQADHCKYCAHVACSKCDHPQGRSWDSDRSERDSEEEVLLEVEVVDGEGSGVLSGEENIDDGEGEEVVCSIPRYVEKMKCCGCGQGMEKKPIMCETCGHEECNGCHYLEKVED